MTIKTKFYYLSLISLLASASFNPNIANADPKTDISNYESAFDQGDIDKAIELGEIAFSNAKRELSAESAYIAKIGYDLASMYLITKNYKKALAPIETTRNIAIKNPSIIGANEINLIEIMYGISLYENYYNNKQNSDKLKEATKIMSSNLSKITLNEDNADYILAAANDLTFHNMENREFIKAAESADYIIKSAPLIYKPETQALNQNLVNGYTARAVGIFINSFSKRKTYIPEEGKLLSSEDTKLSQRKWYDALSDFYMARKFYGAPKSEDDQNYYTLAAWDTLISSFALQNYSKDELKKINRRIFDETNNGKEIDFFKNDKEELCKNKIKIKYNINYDMGLLNHNSFGAALARFDIGEDNKIKNIRILASTPDKEFGDDLLRGLKNSKPAEIEPNTPAICLKDYFIKAHFLVN